MLLLLGATIGFASMHAVIRIASTEQHPFEVAFFRNLFGLVFLSPFFMRHGFHVLRTQRLPLHAARGAVHVAAMLMFFLAVPVTPLGTIAALSFTAPLFVTIGAVLVLGEVVRIRRIVALIAGFAGALVIIRPGMAALEPGTLLVLGSSAVWAAAMILIKLLSRTESSLTMTAYMAVFLTPLSFIAAVFVWQWPTLEEIGWFALMGSFGTLSHLCLAQAFREADASVVLPVDFLRLIWASVLGYLLFNEIPVLYVWIGGTIIFASTLYLAYREAKVARAKLAAETGPQPPS
jgi:drug/metabolite transporter (DMT)-like permease